MFMNALWIAIEFNQINLSALQNPKSWPSSDYYASSDFLEATVTQNLSTFDLPLHSMLHYSPLADTYTSVGF